MVCAVRYAIAIIKNETGKPLTEETIKRLIKQYNTQAAFDILIDTIDSTETIHGTVVTAEVDNRDGSREHATTPVKSVVITLFDETNGTATFLT